MARIAIAVALSIAACAGGEPPMSAEGGTRDLGAEAAVDAPADAGGQDRADDVGGGDGGAGASLAFERFWRERTALREARFAACFEVVPSPELAPVPAALVQAVAASRARFDPERARLCLASLETISCAELLVAFEDGAPGCAGVLTGLVGEGSACGSDHECRDGDRFACVEGAPTGACGRVCAARIAAGGDCSSGRCVPGSFCRLLRPEGAPAQFRCAALPGDGQPCDDRCAAGLFCAREGYDGLEGIDEGVCRPRVSGAACANDWHCPLPLLCVRDAPAGLGRCGPPRAGLGQPCAPGIDECAPGVACLPTMGGGFACQRGPGAGGACGYLEVAPGKSESVGCATGFCDLSAGIRRGVCVASRAAGAPCRGTIECAAGLSCAPGPTGRAATCQAHAPEPPACDFWNRCGPGHGCQAGRCVPVACDDPGGDLDVIAGQPPGGTFQRAFVHAPAARQPTPLGRRIGALEAWQGRLYLGYGDYDGNTGPIVVSSYDPASALVTEALTFDTEAIALYRPIGDKLYAPATDPRGATAPTYAVGAPWTAAAGFAATHVFDMAGDGTTLWAAGAEGSDAVVWRSGDGGARWTESLREKSAGDAFFMRYYFVGTLAGKLHVQAVPSETGQSRVFDGAAWVPGPNLLPLGGQGWKPSPWKGDLVYLSWQPIGPQGGTLLSFDGAAVQPLLPEEVLDFAVTPDAVYALGGDGRLRRSDDLVHWRTLGVAPMGARTLAVLAGRVYVGGTEGRIFVIEDAP